MRRASEHEGDGGLPLTSSEPRFGRREFLRLAALGAGAAFLQACRGNGGGPSMGETPMQQGLPASLRSVADMVRAQGAQPGLLVFLGGQAFLAGQQQRMPFGLVREGFPVEGGLARVWVAAEGSEPTDHRALFKSYLKPERDGPTGFYVTEAAIPSAGIADVLVELKHESGHFFGTAPFQPRARPTAPAPGQEAISVATPTEDDPRGVAVVCTRRPPCPLHDQRLDRALDGDKPVVFTISSPLLCTSRTCGPVLDEVLAVRDQIPAGAASFVHAEPFKGEVIGPLSPAAEAWKIESEPWTWVIGGDGTVRARFEGPVVAEEITDALTPLL